VPARAWRIEPPGRRHARLVGADLAQPFSI